MATGSIKAQLAAIVAGITNFSGSIPKPTATEAITGRKAAAVAVLLDISVRNIIYAVKIMIRTTIGIPSTCII